MNGMTNNRKPNEDMCEPWPKRSKPAKFGASTTRPPIYEERRYGNSCMKWPQRGRPQRERRFKWTIKENTMPLTNQNMIWSHQGTGGFSGGPPQIQQTPELPPLNKIDINELFQNLVSSGVLGPGGVIAAAPEKKAPQPIAIQPIDLAKRETIRTRQTAPVDSLYSGMQCSNCSQRFPPKKTIEYGQHLDWHFHQKRLVRDQLRKGSSRRWYSSIANWIQHVAGEDSEKSGKNVKRLSSPTPPSCPASPIGVDNACEICQEDLEQFYHDDAEEWHLRNGIKVDERVFHPLCYEDDKVKFSKKPMNVIEDEHKKKTAEAAPSNWAEWKALKLQLGQPSQR